MAGRRSFGQVYLRGSTWYIRIRQRWILRFQKVGPDKKVAEDLLADIRAKMAREEALGIREVTPATLGEVWAVIEKTRRARLTTRGFQVQRDHVKAAIEFFGTRAVSRSCPSWPRSRPS